MSESAVIGYLKQREEVPISIRKISNELKIKKRHVLAICVAQSCISAVHPTHCASGRNKLSVFVHSNKKKWVVEKPIYEVNYVTNM